MKDNFGRAIGTCIVGLGLLAFVISAPAGDTRRPDYPETVEGSEPLDPLSAAIAQWPEGPQKAARRLMEKYGPPSEVSAGHLVWHDNGPWKRTVVQQEEVEHNFPQRHFDSVSQSIHYRVPADKFDELARFDGSLLADRTAGLLTSRCDREEMNFLAVNLAHDVLRGGKGVEEARQFFAKTAVMSLTGKSTPYTEGLLFKIGKAEAADPDRAVVQPGRP